MPDYPMIHAFSFIFKILFMLTYPASNYLTLYFDFLYFPSLYSPSLYFTLLYFTSLQNNLLTAGLEDNDVIDAMSGAIALSLPTLISVPGTICGLGGPDPEASGDLFHSKHDIIYFTVNKR